MQYPSVTVGVINYNDKETLQVVLEAALKLDYPSYNILVVDNGSSDGSLEMIKEFFPSVRVSCLYENQGSAAARNEVLASVKGNYAFLLDSDTVVVPDTLTILMDVMLHDSRIAVCHAELRDEGDPFVYHYNGGNNHFLGGLISRRKPQNGTVRPGYEVFTAVSGTAILVDMEAARRVGGFDEDFFFNLEDFDFTTRISLAGFQVVNVPAAIAFHHYKPRGLTKAFYQVRNRWHYILKLYSLRTILLLAPAFFVFDLSQGLILGIKGAGLTWIFASFSILFDLPGIIKKRRAFQRIKKVPDRVWLQAGPLFVPQNLVKTHLAYRVKSLHETIYAIYWYIIRRFL